MLQWLNSQFLLQLSVTQMAQTRSHLNRSIHSAIICRRCRRSRGTTVAYTRPTWLAIFLDNMGIWSIMWVVLFVAPLAHVFNRDNRTIALRTLNRSLLWTNAWLLYSHQNRKNHPVMPVVSNHPWQWSLIDPFSLKVDPLKEHVPWESMASVLRCFVGSESWSCFVGVCGDIAWYLALT